MVLAAVGVRLFDAAVADVGKPYWIVFHFDLVGLRLLRRDLRRDRASCSASRRRCRCRRRISTI